MQSGPASVGDERIVAMQITWSHAARRLQHLPNRRPAERSDGLSFRALDRYRSSKEYPSGVAAVPGVLHRLPTNAARAE